MNPAEPTDAPAAEWGEYVFTDKERAFFTKQLDELTRMTLAINNAPSLICAQQGLSGAWQLKQDGSGLLKAPPAQEQ